MALVVRVSTLLWGWARWFKHWSVLITTSSVSILEASNQVGGLCSRTWRLIPHTGVGRTTPGIDAFRGERLQRQVWGIRNLDTPTPSGSVEALPRIIAIEKLNNKLIADKEASIAPYVGTAAVAHDMLSIVEALGQGSLVQMNCSSH